MLISRGSSCLKLLNSLSKTANVNGLQQLRHSSHKMYYRTPPDPVPRINVILGNAAGGVFWWWVLWHLFTEPGHIVGEFPYPDPSKWTNAELGIPED